jgi:hypothetical protein
MHASESAHPFEQGALETLGVEQIRLTHLGYFASHALANGLPNLALHLRAEPMRMGENKPAFLVRQHQRHVVSLHDAHREVHDGLWKIFVPVLREDGLAGFIQGHITESVSPLRRPPHGMHEVLDAGRLEQEVEGAGVQATDRQIEIRVACDHYNLHSRRRDLDPSQELEAREPWHPDVRNNDVEGALRESMHCLAAIGGANDLTHVLFQLQMPVLALDLVIVN